MIRRVTTLRVRSAGLVVLLAGLALGGCSSPNRAAGYLGTRVCIVNESSKAATVVFTRRDTARGEGSLAQGNQACGEGTTFGTGNDVEGTITLASPLPEVLVSGDNPVLKTPYVIAMINGRKCVLAVLSVGEKDRLSVWDDGVLRYDVQRLADGQWKEFVLTLTDSEQPSSSGLPAQCPDWNDLLIPYDPGGGFAPA